MDTYSAPLQSPPAGANLSGPQPHSFDAERAVLGALLLSERAMYTLIIEGEAGPRIWAAR
jgi:hypothetical protein